MKTKYFKDNESYFKFINKNKDKKIKQFCVTIINNKIKVIYQFI